MSSTRQFTLEYIIKVTGGGAAAGQINQVNNQLKATNPTLKQTAAGFQQVEKSSHRAGQGMVQTTGHMKSIAFGMIGLTSAGVEAIGMLGMWSDTARRTDEAQVALNDAVKQFGEGSAQATRASQELTKAQRFQAMTQRNLILSLFDMVPFTLLLVNGIREQILLTKQLRVAQQSLAATNAAAATAERARVASQLSLVGSTNTLIGSHFRLTPQLLATAVATGGITTANIAYTRSATGAAVATSRLGAIMSSTWLRVLGPIAIGIGAIIAAMAAYKTNAMGFRDITDQIGVALGNTFPFLEGILNRIKNIALAFPDFGKMFKAAMGIGEASSKDTDELAKAIDELNASAAELMKTLASADKGERKDLLNALGIKGDAAKEFSSALDVIDKIQTRVTGFADALTAIRQIDIWDKFGLKDLDAPKIFEKMFFTLEDRFDAASEKFKKGSFGKKLFNGLEATMKQAAKDPKHGPEIIANYLANNPQTISYLNQLGFIDEAKALQTIADEALKKQLSNTSAEVEGMSGDELGVLGPGYSNVQGEIDKIITNLKTAIQNGDWASVGLIFREHILTIFNIKNMNNLGNIIRANIVDPIFVALGGAFKPAIEAFKKDPVGFTIGTVITASEWVGAFVAGLFGYKSEAELFNDVEAKLIGIFNNNPHLVAIRKFIANPLGSLIDMLKGRPIGGSAAGSFNESEAGAFRGGFGSGDKPGFTLPTFDDILDALGITAFLDSLPTFEEIKSRILADPNVQKLIEIYKAISGSVDNFIKWIMSLGQTASATGDMSGAVNSRFTGAMSPGEAVHKRSLDFQVPNVNIIPGDITVLPPTNTTPTTPMTITPQSLTVAPQSIQVAWPGAGFQNPMDSPANKSTGPLGGIFAKGGFEMLRISVPSITVAPQTVNFDVIASKLVLLQQGFFVIAQEISTIWNTTMIAMSSIANTTVVAIASVFGAMVVNISAGITGLASTWSAICNSFGANAESGASQIIDAINNAMSQAASAMSKLASHWSSMCNSMVANAKSAVSRINKELNKLERTVTTTHKIVTKKVNAASGFHGVVSNPTTFNVAEGGRPEFVSVTPLSDFKTNGSKNGMTSTLSVKTPNASIQMGRGDGDCVINVYLDGQKIKGNVVKMLSRNQMGMKE